MKVRLSFFYLNIWHLQKSLTENTNFTRGSIWSQKKRGIERWRGVGGGEGRSQEGGVHQGSEHEVLVPTRTDHHNKKVQNSRNRSSEPKWEMALLKKKVKIVLQKVELGCQNILLNHWFAATKKCQMHIFILISTQHGATLHQDHVLQDALKRQKEECKEWTSHSNRYNKKIEQKIIALITLGVPQQLFCVCPGTLKASSRPSDDIHRQSHKLPALVRDHALSLARNRNKSSEVFYLLKWNVSQFW